MKRFLIGVAALVCGFLALREAHRLDLACEHLPFARFPAATVQSVELLQTCVDAITAQSDPAKLASLGKRQANPRLKRILY